jgi:hypothetical protein
MPMKRISVHLTDGEIAALKALALETGLKTAELLRRMIDDGLVRAHRPHRWKLEVPASPETLTQTDAHASAEERVCPSHP